MVYVRAAGMVVMIAFLAGCPARRGPEPAPAPDPWQTLEQVRREFQRADPRVQVGLVGRVSENDRLASVREIPLDQLRQGAVINIVDHNRRPIVSGTVIRITDVSAHIRYESPRDERRHPQEGDLAVYIGQR